MLINKQVKLGLLNDYCQQRRKYLILKLQHLLMLIALHNWEAGFGTSSLFREGIYLNFKTSASGVKVQECSQDKLNSIVLSK